MSSTPEDAHFSRKYGLPAFMFATGIESSAPTIAGGVRRDEMELCDHYGRWREDFDLVEELGVMFLRYGPPLHRTFLGVGRYDWEFADATLNDLLRRNVVPIVDLCHFGVPDWIGDFQNPDFPALFADYARDFARRFPWVQLYTPVNEMYICAKFSARYGWWNERLAGEASFVTALKHLVRANVLAMDAILAERPDAIFIQSESTEHFHPTNPAAMPAAAKLNQERFLSLDLNYSRPVDSVMYQFLLDNGMTRAEYEFFMAQDLKAHCVMGNDYYVTNEHRVLADGATEPAGEVFGYSQITSAYFRRYELPVMHTETNYCQGMDGDEAVYWLWKEWANVQGLRDNGMPIVGFTWYSLIDQVDWDTGLREANNRVNPLGLFDLDRRIRAVGRAYRALVSDWRAVLPTQSVCLRVPVRRPQDHRSDRPEPAPAPPQPDAEFPPFRPTRLGRCAD